MVLLMFSIVLGCNFSHDEKKGKKKPKSSTHLNLSNNPKLDQIPSYVYENSNLKHLDISNTQISGWDERICQLENLEVLVGKNNTYNDDGVPFHTFCLKNLKILDMSNSSIKYIDEHIAKLEKLEELHMSNNKMISAPYMLVSLKNLRLVDLSNNPLADEDLSTAQVCEDAKDEDCRQDIADSFECEFFNKLPHQRPKPFRTIYIDIVDSSDEIKEACNKKEDVSRICPHFVKSCMHMTDMTKRKSCMLDEFESLNIHPDLWIHRDVCYESWAKWYNDFEESPELKEYSISGRTIEEMLLRTEYIEEHGSPSKLCWNSWSPVSDVDFLWWDNKPDRIGPRRFEVFPEKKREFVFSDGVLLAIREGIFDWISYDEETTRSKYVEYADRTKICPHLKDLKKMIEKRIVLDK